VLCVVLGSCLFASSQVPWYLILANTAAVTSPNLIAGTIQKSNDDSFPKFQKVWCGSETLTIYPRRRGTGRLSNTENAR
jgi:hypothetical protein